MLVFPDIPVKPAFIGISTGTAVCPSECMILSVVFERAKGGYFNRIGIDPPVQQIEVMGRLMNKQGAAFIAFTMPAAEIIGSVIGVQLPVKIDRCNPAGFLLHQ